MSHLSSVGTSSVLPRLQVSCTESAACLWILRSNKRCRVQPEVAADSAAALDARPQQESRRVDGPSAADDIPAVYHNAAPAPPGARRRSRLGVDDGRRDAHCRVAALCCAARAASSSLSRQKYAVHSESSENAGSSSHCVREPRHSRVLCIRKHCSLAQRRQYLRDESRDMQVPIVPLSGVGAPACRLMCIQSSNIRYIFWRCSCGGSPRSGLRPTCQGLSSASRSDHYESHLWQILRQTRAPSICILQLALQTTQAMHGRTQGTSMPWGKIAPMHAPVLTEIRLHTACSASVYRSEVKACSPCWLPHCRVHTLSFRLLCRNKCGKATLQTMVNSRPRRTSRRTCSGVSKLAHQLTLEPPPKVDPAHSQRHDRETKICRVQTREALWVALALG